MSILTKSQIKKIIKHYNLKEGKEIHEVLKDMFKDVLEEMLEGELEDELGYGKYEVSKKRTLNSRNGYSKKQVKSTFGEFDLQVPRDRNGEFYPIAVKKGQSDVSGIEGKILGLYKNGMSTRDIAEQMEDLYGVNVSADTISRITDKILPIIKQWQNRPLEAIYPILYLDGFRVRVKSEGHYVMKTAHIVMGIDLNGMKDILGIYLAENESAKFWLSVLNDLKNRGVNDIFIACIDGLTGFKDAIKAVFNQSEIQRCVIHQIRNSTKFVSYKDLKAFCKDLKTIYQAPTECLGLDALQAFANKWEKKYPYAVKSWYNNWEDLATFYYYPAEIRKLIYTTNPIESFNRVLRKYTKTRTQFPTEESAMKVLYLATCKMKEKWTQRVRNWNQVIGQFYIKFEERIEQYL